VVWTYGYDGANQLRSAVKASAATQAVLTRYAYSYDPAGNRTAEQIDDQVTGASYDALNRLVSQQPTGALVVAGTVSEPATVTVQGVPATVTAANGFTAQPEIGVATNTLAITATDASGNTAAAQYEIDSLGAARTLTYDANGNLAGDGIRIFEWDARNQLVAITTTSHRSEFTYDGRQRRTHIKEIQGGLVTSDRDLIWCGQAICEERQAGVALRRLFMRGEQVLGNARFHVADHLQSVVAITDSLGSLIERYIFDPSGRRRPTTGSEDTAVGFTGHYVHNDGSGELVLAPYRAYDPEMGRWLSSDPIGLRGGLNLYRYVENDPVKYVDPLGLKSTCTTHQAEFTGVTVMPCNGDGCTRLVYGALTGPCIPMTNCKEKWKFDGAVAADIQVFYRRNGSEQYEAGKTVRDHENEHVGDYLNFCPAVEQLPTEGFATRAECEFAKRAWFEAIESLYQRFDKRTAQRDR
jgi:RHS repeat-associated protein